MSATLAPPAPRAIARPGLILLLACVAQFMLLVDDTIVNVALPTVASDLGFSESSLSWVVNAYLLTFGGFLLIGGRLADRFGPRRLFSLALAGFAAASALCGLAPSAEVLVGARAAQGITAALLSPAALAILLHTFPEGPERRRALSAWAALMGLGAATGLIAGGVLVEVADWRWIFLVNLPVAALALAAVPRVLPDFDASTARPAPNVAGALLATAALLLLVFTVVETDGEGWTSARSLAGFAGAAVLALGVRAHREALVLPAAPARAAAPHPRDVGGRRGVHRRRRAAGDVLLPDALPPAGAGAVGAGDRAGVPAVQRHDGHRVGRHRAAAGPDRRPLSRGGRARARRARAVPDEHAGRRQQLRGRRPALAGGRGRRARDRVRAGDGPGDGRRRGARRRASPPG